MYTPHSQLTLEYPDSQRIWRYMRRERFQKLVRDGSLFFCRADGFDDKWEGRFPIKMIEKFNLAARKIPSSDGQSYTGIEWQVQKEVPSHLVNCWHVNDQESFAMWKIYGADDPSCIAIQSTLGRLKESFKATDEQIWIGEVEYVDFREWEPGNRFFNAGTPNTLKTFFLKWHYFEFEREIRAVLNKACREQGDPKGMLVPVDLSVLIEHVYVSPTGSDEEEKTIKAILSENTLTISTRRFDMGMRLYM